MARLDIHLIIRVMRSIRIIVLLSSIIALVSCNQAQAEFFMISTREVAAPEVSYQSSNETPLPTETKFPIDTLTVTPTVITDTPEPIITYTPKPVFQLCSPLAEQSILEIPDIVSDPYNPPPTGKDDRHHGTDFAYYRRKNRTSIEGEEVQALLAGRVVALVEDQPPYGNMVIVETLQSALPPAINAQIELVDGDGLFILYAHFRTSPVVTLGDQIACGQVLGEVGASGYNIINPHLHIETRVGPTGWFFWRGWLITTPVRAKSNVPIMRYGV